MTNMGVDFKVPRQGDREQWKKVELLARSGVIFHWRFNAPHEGPGARPARLRDVEAFLENRKKQTE